MNSVHLGLGSNLGDRESNLAKALGLLTPNMSIDQLSSIYETEPVGYVEQPWFLNMACSGKTSLDPFELLSFAKEIETSLGRVASFSNAPRTIDIDILFYEDRSIDTVALVIPHPRIAERAFVLVPLTEIAPEFVHPLSGKSTRELLSVLNDSSQVRKWGNVPSIGSAAL